MTFLMLTVMEVMKRASCLLGSKFRGLGSFDSVERAVAGVANGDG